MIKKVFFELHIPDNQTVYSETGYYTFGLLTIVYPTNDRVNGRCLPNFLSRNIKMLVKLSAASSINLEVSGQLYYESVRNLEKGRLKHLNFAGMNNFPAHWYRNAQ